MEGEYSFKQQKCSCGLALTGKVSPVSTLYRGVRPMGACPSCGTGLLLDASPETSEVVLDYEPDIPQKVQTEAKVAGATESAEIEQSEVRGMSQGQGQDVPKVVPQPKSTRSKTRRR